MIKQDPNNPFYPLPADYGELTGPGQKEARLATLRDQSTPEKLVESWHLFRNLYLKPMGESFYKGGFVPSPSFHFQAVRDLSQYGRNALGAPRGSAKSTVIGKEIPMMLLLTRPYYPMTLCLATDSLVEARLDEIMIQLTDNPLILEDFGEMKPKRGTAIWNHHHLHCTNGAILNGLSVMGKKRGGRPRLFLLDDPENDPDSESETSQTLMLEKFEKILFRQIIPMLEHGSSIFWVGTLINRRSFLYHACCTDDARFQFWNRRVLEAIHYDADSKGKEKVSVLWKEKWPKEVLEARRKEIGEAAFAAEYMNNPISATERLFSVKPRLNEYRLDGAEDIPVDPMNETSDMICYKVEDQQGTPVFKEYKQPFKEWASKLFKVTAFDYASGLSQYHDYSCIGVFGFDTDNCLWVLDMWLGRARDSVLLRQIYDYSRKWRVRIIGIESASVQISFTDAVGEYVKNQLGLGDGAWIPRVMPVKYPYNVSKPQRISGLDWRYPVGKIKYPEHVKRRWPFSMLYSQTHDFTMDMAMLRFDDAIDTLAMSQYIVHSKGVKSRLTNEKDKKSLMSQIKAGRSIIPGMPILSGVNSTDLTAEQLYALLDKTYTDAENKSKSAKYEIRRPHATYNPGIGGIF